MSPPMSRLHSVRLLCTCTKPPRAAELTFRRVQRFMGTGIMGRIRLVSHGRPCRRKLYLSSSGSALADPTPSCYSHPWRYNTLDNWPTPRSCVHESTPIWACSTIIKITRPTLCSHRAGSTPLHHYSIKTPIRGCRLIQVLR